MDATAFDKLVVDTLRDVHDRGADLYNTKKDFKGTYRLYQGALLTVRPLLAHRPAAQKIIDAGLAAAEKETDPATQAYMLHKTIEEVRAHMRASGSGTVETPKPMEKKPEEKKPDDKKPDVKKPEEKKPVEPKPPVDPKPIDPKPMSKAPGLSGTVTLMGKPLASGTLTFVTLDQSKPRVLAAAIKDGKYAVELPPGKYAVAVSSEKDGKELLPRKYNTTDTSGLRIDVKPGANNFDIKLD